MNLLCLALKAKGNRGSQEATGRFFSTIDLEIQTVRPQKTSVLSNESSSNSCQGVNKLCKNRTPHGMQLEITDQRLGQVKGSLSREEGTEMILTFGRRVREAVLMWEGDPNVY